MRRYEYEGRGYDAYDDVEEFIRLSGKSYNDLVYHKDIANAVVDIYEEALVRGYVGKYAVLKGMYIMPILCVGKGKRGIDILLPIGWVRVTKKTIHRIERATPNDEDVNFVAMFILTGNLELAYQSAYKARKTELAIVRLFDVIEKLHLKERIIAFMKQNGLENIFDKHGITDDFLLGKLKEKIEEGKVSVGDILKVMDAKAMLDVKSKSNEIDYTVLPALPED